MPTPLKPGDVVHLKSGGPSMTVEFQEDDEAACTWFDGTKKLSDRFAIATLELGPSPNDPTIAKRSLSPRRIVRG